MRSRPVIQFVLFMFCLNSFLLLVAACMKTIPAETVSIAGTLNDNGPLLRLPVPQSDYSAHLKQFRAAKLFRSPTAEVGVAASAASASSVETTDTGSIARVSHRETIQKSAKVFAAKTETISETPSKEVVDPVEESTVSNRDDNNVHDDRDLFEALQVEKPDICGTCPSLWMKNDAEMKEVCSNHESVSTFFSMTMDKRDAKNIVDNSDLKECTRTVTCSEPHMLIKWYESELCDVHAPSTGSLVSDTSNTFVYKCNGTHWSMHGFPLTSVVCAISSN